ncbi:MAG: DUF2339 domain-containing protein [Caldilineaceae bacterium]
MSEFFNCLTIIGAAAVLIGVVNWMRRQLHHLQQQIDALGQQLTALDVRIGGGVTATAQTEAEAATATVPLSPTVTEELPLADHTPTLPPTPVTMPPLVPLSVDLTAVAADAAQSSVKNENLLLEDAGAPPLVLSAPPQAPARPHPLLAWFTQMNIMVQIGLIILFFGVAFLVKYAADQGWLSLELRLAGAALLGVALTGGGWHLRTRVRGYGLALIGGGIGIVYLTTFGAYRLYALIPATPAFAIFVGLGVLYAVMALLNDAQILAFLALVGGLLAPILAASGGGSHVMLFSYYLAVNTGTFAIAWFKAWRRLNLASFVLVLVAAGAWGAAEYMPALFSSTEPFLIIFFLFYLTITLLTTFRPRQPTAQGKLAISDVILLFANPLVTLALQAALVGPLADAGELWLARTALALALVYAALALWSVWQQRGRAQGLTVEAFIFLATFFLAISIPLLYDQRITAAVWAILGAALHWLGARRRQGWAHLWGLVVRLAATAAFVADVVNVLDETSAAVQALPLFTNHIYIGATILSLSTLLAAWWLHTEEQRRASLYRWSSGGMLVWGLLWWFGSGMLEIGLHIPNERYLFASLVAFVMFSCVSAEMIGSWLQWGGLRLTLTLLLPLLAWLALAQLAWGETVWSGGSWLAWPLAIFAHFFALKRFEQWPWQKHRWQAIFHAGGVWFVTFLLTCLAYEWTGQQTAIATWRGLPLLLVPTFVFCVVGILAVRLPWPFGSYPRWYSIGASLPLALYLVISLFIASVELAGNSAPLPYLPVLNPLTLTVVVALLVLWQWLRNVETGAGEVLHSFVWLSKIAVGILAFMALNAALARDIHQLFGVPFVWDALFAAEILQTTYAIVWSVLALVLMFLGNRRGRAQSGWTAVWFFGAAILALTVLKLFLVDLANTGAIARIVSFMGVGLLIIVIAYFAPLPSQPKVAVLNESSG